MAASGSTPIQLYRTSTAGVSPSAANLTDGELAINTNPSDGKLFYKDSTGVVQTIASKAAAEGNFPTVTLSGGTANGVGYLNASKVLTTGSALTFDGSTLTAPSFSGQSNSATSTFIQSGTGAVTRTAQDKMREAVSVKDFGVVGDGVTDDTVNFQKAITYVGSLGGGALYIPNGLKILIDSADIVIPKNVTIRSNYESFSFANLSSTSKIIVNPLYTIRINDISCCLIGLVILRKGLVISATAPASFSGIGVRLESLTGGLTDNAYIANCHISGFEYAIWGDKCGRYEFNFITGDNTNGIYTKGVQDVGRMNDCHFWPFFTSGTGGSSYRTGTAYTFDVENDWSQAQNCFSFNYETGFKILANSVRLIGCGADGNLSTSVSGTSKGFHITGLAVDAELIGCEAAARHSNYYYDSSQHGTLTSCAGWGAVPTHVNIQAGTLYVNSSHFYGTASSAAVTVGSSVSWAKIDGCTFNDVGPIYSINSAAQYKTDILPNNIYLGSSIGINSNTARKIIPTTSTGMSYYSIGGGNGFQNKNFLATGSPTSPAIVAAGLTLGAYRFGGHDGSAFIEAGVIKCGVDATPSAGIIPTNIVFTVTNTSGVTADRIAIKNTGYLVPLTDNAYQIGQTGSRWSSIWAANGTIQTSDSRTKDNISDSSLGLEFIKTLRPVSYTWKVGGNEVIRQVYRDAEGNECQPDEDGAIASEIISKEVVGKRTHWGLIAQEVKQSADDAGVDFAGWVLSDKDDPDSQQALRYDQFIAPLIKAVQELSAKVAALESK